MNRVLKFTLKLVKTEILDYVIMFDKFTTVWLAVSEEKYCGVIYYIMVFYYFYYIIFFNKFGVSSLYDEINALFESIKEVCTSFLLNLFNERNKYLAIFIC